MTFRDDGEAQRARVEALERELAAAREAAEEAERARQAAVAELERVRQEHEKAPDTLIEDAVGKRSVELERLRRQKQARDAEALPATSAMHERPMVVWNLRRTTHTVFLVLGGVGWLGVGPFSAAFGEQPMLENERVAMQWMTFGSLTAGIVGTVLLVASLIRLHRLRSKLPFELDSAGWAKLVDQKYFWIAEFWWPLVVTVEGGTREEVASVLEKLCARANRTFYAPEDATGDERLRWTADGRRARGSANRSTAYALLEWCRKDLAPLARKDSSVRHVGLTVGDAMVSVSRPST